MTLYWLRKNDGQFTTPALIDDKLVAHVELLSSNHNYDGRIDEVMYDNFHSRVYQDYRTGVSSTQSLVSDNSEQVGVEAHDFKGDGSLDLLMSSAVITSLFNAQYSGIRDSTLLPFVNGVTLSLVTCADYDAVGNLGLVTWSALHPALPQSHQGDGFNSNVDEIMDEAFNGQALYTFDSD